MTSVIEQKSCTKFCFHNKFSAFKMLQKSFKDDFLSKTTAFDQYKKFNDGRESFVDDLKSDRQPF